MRHKLPLLAGALAALAIASAVAQTVVQTSFSGDEVFRAAQGPGGPEAWMSLAAVRNGSQIRVASGSGAVATIAVGGTLCWKGTAPTTWAVALPAAPGNGITIVLCSDTTLTTLVTVTAGSGDTLTTTYASQTITANASFPAWQYRSTDKVWYRVQ